MENGTGHYVGGEASGDGERHAVYSRSDEGSPQAWLRQIEQYDLETLRDWRNQDEIRLRCREYRLLNMVNQQGWFETVSRDRETEMFAILASRIPACMVGVCGLTHINWKDRHAEVSIYIGKKDGRGKGYGTLALEDLAKVAFLEYGLHRLWAEIYSFNAPARLLFKKCNYRREGMLYETVWYNGEWAHSYIFGLLVSDWRATCEK